MRSTDGGRTWDEPVQSPAFPEGSGSTVKAVWFIRPGHASRPGEVWAGVEPAALFHSQDWGVTWELVGSLGEHPSTRYWTPGGGGLCLHGISLDPVNADSLVATISSGGAYRTDDSGATWRPINAGVRADFMPDKTAPAGHCVHKLVRSAQQPDFLFQQNHCGAYVSANGGDNWAQMADYLPPVLAVEAAG